jgi:hypothetical protein
MHCKAGTRLQLEARVLEASEAAGYGHPLLAVEAVAAHHDVAAAAAAQRELCGQGGVDLVAEGAGGEVVPAWQEWKE